MVLKGPSWLERYRVSKQIMGQSFSLVATMRSYWVFPMVGALLMFLVVGAAMFAGSTGIQAEVSSPASDAGFLGVFGQPLFWLTIVLMFPVMLVMTVLNSALAYGFYRRLKGDPVGVRVAWRKALSQIGPILRYSLIAYTVGMVLGLLGQVLEKLRFIPGLGSIVQIVGTFGWAAATFFVIPVIMVEREMKATGALRKSVRIARDNWGKSVSGIITIALALLVPVFLVLVPAMMVFPFLMAFLVPIEHAMVAMMVFFAVVLLAVMAVAAVSSTTQVAYQTGLYLYATTGQVHPPFTTKTLVDAWAPYRSR